MFQISSSEFPEATMTESCKSRASLSSSLIAFIGCVRPIKSKGIEAWVIICAIVHHEPPSPYSCDTICFLSLQFKSRPATSPLDWDSDAEASPEHQSEPILDRGLLTLSPIAKSTPCLVPRPHSRSAGPPHDSSRATRRRYVQEKGVQTSKTLGVVVAGVDAAMQTDLSTNMPIFRESACSPLPWRPCPSCGCHRETAASSPNSVVSSPEEADPPVCRSASSGETETGSILTDFLIGVTREE